VRRPTMATSSRVRVRERLVPRRLFAVVAVVFPVVVEIAVTGVWWDRLPDRIATTFGPDGSPTGYGTPAGTVILFAALQALFLAAAIGSAVARDRRKGRIGCAVTAGFVAALGVSWLIIAGSASSSLSSAAWWFLASAPAWACVPYWLLSPRGVKGTDH
jgi:hypothetical protein